MYGPPTRRASLCAFLARVLRTAGARGPGGPKLTQAVGPPKGGLVAAEDALAAVGHGAAHPYSRTGGACDLPRSAGNRGRQTVIGFAVERLGEFWI